MSGYIVQQILNGIQLGLIYALIALGYTMVYGIIKLINFAHADVFMVGAYIAFFVAAFCTGMNTVLPFWMWVWIALAAAYLLSTIAIARITPLSRLFNRIDSLQKHASLQKKFLYASIRNGLQLCFLLFIATIAVPVLYYGSVMLYQLPLGPWLFLAVMIYSMSICAMLGAALERIVYRPLRYRPRLSVLITAMGASLFIENFSSLDMVFGSAYRAFPEILPKVEMLHIKSLDIVITSSFCINVAVVSLLLGGLWYLVGKTLIGKQMRAVSFNKHAAALMGIDIDAVITKTFMVGAALAGGSGVLYAMNYGVLQSPFLGFYPGIKAFIAAVLGGIGNLPGAVLGAFIMGISEVFANSIDSNLGFAAAFVVLICILLFKPTGLLGKQDHEKI